MVYLQCCRCKYIMKHCSMFCKWLETVKDFFIIWYYMIRTYDGTSSLSGYIWYFGCVIKVTNINMGPLYAIGIDAIIVVDVFVVFISVCNGGCLRIARCIVDNKRFSKFWKTFDSMFFMTHTTPVNIYILSASAYIELHVMWNLLSTAGRTFC